VPQNSAHSLSEPKKRFGNASAVAISPFLLRRPTAKRQNRAEYFFHFLLFVMLFASSPLRRCKKTRQKSKSKKSNAPARQFFFVMLFATSPLRRCKKTRQKNNRLEPI
jgi:hypothetical protein